MTLTLLANNYVERRGLLAEHGFACSIQCGNRQVLFDTGQGQTIEHNAAKLGLDLTALDAVVISHGHYDHTGSLSRVMQLSPEAALFMHPAALEAKFARRSVDSFSAIGVPVRGESLRRLRSRVTATEGPTEVLPGLWVTGMIPRCPGARGVETRFFLDPEGKNPDPLVDDQALFFDTEHGLVVVLGCAHAGVLCTLRYVLSLCPGRPVSSVIGGMHMRAASVQQRRSIVESLIGLGVRQVVPAHCSGLEFAAQLAGAYGCHCEWPAVGSSWRYTLRMGLEVRSAATSARIQLSQSR